MFGQIKTNNFYRTTLDSSINNTSETGTFDVVDKTVDGISLVDGTYTFRLVIQIDDSTKREIFRCTSVSGYTITYDLRISPNGKQTHTTGDLVSMNDFSEVINFFSDNVDSFGYIEEIAGTGNELKIKVYGGRVFRTGDETLVVADTTLTLTDDSTLYIYYDSINEEFNFTTVEPNEDTYYTVAKVVTSSGDILSTYDYRSSVLSGGGGGGGSGGHIIKNTDQGGTATELTQRGTLRTKKLITTDDSINLETVIEGKWIATPDYIATGNTEYIEANTQMIVEGTLTIDGTLDNDGLLVLI